MRERPGDPETCRSILARTRQTRRGRSRPRREWYAERQPSGYDRFLRDVRDVLDIATAFPRAGRQRDELQPSLRSYVAHPYLVFYRVDDAARTVTIVRVLHGSMDLDSDEIEAL